MRRMLWRGRCSWVVARICTRPSFEARGTRYCLYTGHYYFGASLKEGNVSRRGLCVCVPNIVVIVRAQVNMMMTGPDKHIAVFLSRSFRVNPHNTPPSVPPPPPTHTHPCHPPTNVQTLSTDAYTFLVAGVVLLAVLGYALLAALCYGALVLLRSAVRAALRAVRWVLGLHRYLPGVGMVWRSRSSRSSRNGASNSSNASGGGTQKTLSTPERRAAAMAAAVAAGGGLWDEALMTLLGGPGPPDPFPEDALPELDGPAVDRQPAPGAGGRNGSGGGRGGGGGGGGSGGDGGSSRSGSGGGGGGGGGGHLRSLSGELVMWPTAPNDGRTFDFRGWSSGGGGYGNGNGNDVTPHHMKRWD